MRTASKGCALPGSEAEPMASATSPLQIHPARVRGSRSARRRAPSGVSALARNLLRRFSHRSGRRSAVTVSGGVSPSAMANPRGVGATVVAGRTNRNRSRRSNQGTGCDRGVRSSARRAAGPCTRRGGGSCDNFSRTSSADRSSSSPSGVRRDDRPRLAIRAGASNGDGKEGADGISFSLAGRCGGGERFWEQIVKGKAGG